MLCCFSDERRASIRETITSFVCVLLLLLERVDGFSLAVVGSR